MAYNIIGDPYIRNEFSRRVLNIHIPDMQGCSLMKKTGIGRYSISFCHSFHMTATNLNTYTGTAWT